MLEKMREYKRYKNSGKIRQILSKKNTNARKL